VLVVGAPPVPFKPPLAVAIDPPLAGAPPLYALEPPVLAPPVAKAPPVASGSSVTLVQATELRSSAAAPPAPSKVRAAVIVNFKPDTIQRNARSADGILEAKRSQ
jgi:hypothetical protein